MHGGNPRRRRRRRSILIWVIGDILQPTHLLFVLVVALLVLGPKRLPEVGRSLGRGLRDFRGALSGDDRDENPFLSHLERQPAASDSTRTAESGEPFKAAEPAEPFRAAEPVRASEPIRATEPAERIS